MKLTITGDFCTLTSSLRVEDIKLLKKYNPDALKVSDEAGNTKFAVDFSAERPCIAPFGITFSGATRDENGYATVTDPIPAGLNTADKAKEYVADKFMSIAEHLAVIEQRAPAMIQDVLTTRNVFISGITVV